MNTAKDTLRQSRLFTATNAVPKGEEEAKERKSGAARLLEIKQMLFELQEQVDDEKKAFAESVCPCMSQ